MLCLVKKLLHFSILEFDCFLCESRHPPTPASTASLPPHISSQPGGGQVRQTHLPALSSPSYAGRSGGPGRVIPRGTLEPPAVPNSVRVDVCTSVFILSRYMIKQVVAALQGPKSKTRVRIVFKIVRGFNTSFTYNNSIKHVKKMP